MTQDLSERLREIADQIDRAADALDQRDAEIALLKEGRKLHDELADHKDAEIEKWQRVAGQGVSIEHELRKDLLLHNALLAQAAAALERAVLMLSIMKDAGEFQCSDTLKDCREALVALRALG